MFFLTGGSRGGGGSNSELNYCRWEGCKKSFRRYKLLENHERIAHHKEGEDPLTCSTVGCNLTFTDKKALQHHESRCALKPHRCSWAGCDKTFRTSKLLHGHISAVHRKVGRNTFKCSIPGCVQAYPDSTKLKTHEARCRFRYETLRDMDNEAAASARQAAISGNVANSVDMAANSMDSSSSASQHAPSTNEDAMNMSMDAVEQKPSTVDLSFMTTQVKSEVSVDEQTQPIYVQQSQM